MGPSDGALSERQSGPPGRLAAIVLAGGKSRRLGFDKALITVDGEPLISWLPGRLSRHFWPVVVVTDRPGRYVTPFPLVTDTMPDAGPLAGIAAGLAALGGQAAFVCACDMPLLQPPLLQLLAEIAPGVDLAIPERAERLEPLCAIYAASCLPGIQALLAAGQFRAQAVASAVRTRRLREADWRGVDPAGDSFLSVNTPDDLARMRERARAYGLALAPR